MQLTLPNNTSYSTISFVESFALEHIRISVLEGVKIAVVILFNLLRDYYGGDDIWIKKN